MEAELPPPDTIAISVPAGLMAMAIGLGLESEAVFEATGLTAEDLSDPDRIVDNICMFRLWALLRSRFPARVLSLETAEAMDLSMFGIVGAMIRNSRTLREANARFLRYFSLIDRSAEFTIESHGDELSVHIRPGERLKKDPYPIEVMMAMIVKAPRSLLEEPIAVRSVCFEHACFHSPAPYEEYFRGPVTFCAPGNVLRIGAKIADREIPHADTHVIAYLEALASRLAREMPKLEEGGFPSRVRAALQRSINEGDTSQPHVAKALAVSVRTMQRRLSEAGTSFAELQDEVFRSTAAALLDEPVRSAHDVAFLLGYSDVTSFYRAFKRWTGKTPEQYRRDRS